MQLNLESADEQDLSKVRILFLREMTKEPEYGHDIDGVYHWDPEDKRLREDGMAADGSRLNPGDILEDGSEWHLDWPETRTPLASTSQEA